MWGLATPDPARLDECLARLAHRGPDASGTANYLTRSGRHVTLMHARLKIIDLDQRANQPMIRGNWSLIFNGEIYNYREVREVLRSRGAAFSTSSDTEVLLEGLRVIGWEVLGLLEGMWALAAYDAESCRLSLSRDRFGEKPLFVLREGAQTLFASEVPPLQALASVRLRPNLRQVQRLLVNGYKSLYKGGDTFFEDVSEVPAGSVMHFSDSGRVTVERYWNPQLVVDESMSFDSAVAGTRESLATALDIRLRADVPLAFSLSGGVDSVALASIAARELGATVHGFTIANSDPRYEEKALVDLTVSELGIDHTSIPLDQAGFLTQLQDIIRHRGAPIATITYYVQWLLMQEVARSGYKVVVGGTGADELFSGYYDHHLLYIASIAPELRDSARTNWEQHFQSFVRNPFLQDPDRFLVDPGFRDHIYMESERFSGFVLHPDVEQFSEEYATEDLLRNRMWNELFHEIVPVILHEDDLNAMSFSIENRSPYLDRNLMEFAGSIPTRHLVRNGRAKAVLREAVRGIAPSPVIDNPRKIGFNAPISDLVDFDDSGVRDQVMADSPIFDVVRRDSLEGVLDNRSGRNSESKFLFSFLSCKAFLDAFD